MPTKRVKRRGALRLVLLAIFVQIKTSKMTKVTFEIFACTEISKMKFDVFLC